jgi:N-acetylneuraminic acid mutarotase
MTTAPVRVLAATLAAATVLLSACGDKGGNAAAPVSSYNVGGTVSGLVSGASVVLQDNGTNDVAVSANGSFRFSAPVPSGSPFNVSVVVQPQGESCSVNGGSGTVGNADVQVAVTCTFGQFTVGGNLSGLLTGNQLVIENANADSTTLSANGSFTFSSPIQTGAGYAVTILTQPQGQTCAVTNGSGTVVVDNITNVAINCAGNSYNVGGSVSGLRAGTGITVVDNGTDRRTVSNGNFTFNTPLATGAAYAVTLAAQPTGQTCTLANASGTVVASAVTDIGVSCTTDSYTVGGSVSGLPFNGSVVLLLNGADSTPVSSNVGFTFSTPVDSASTYSVTVQTPPTGQTCAIANGSGTMGEADVVDVAVTCAAGLYDVAVTVSGLTGTGLVLQNEGGDNLSISADGLAYFDTPLANGAPYAVTVATQPGGQRCTVSGGSGTIAAANASVAVSCAAITNAWAWMGGSNSVNAAGIYGTQGTAAAGNTPGGRALAGAWTDTAGNFWLFGGFGYASSGANGELNDLWSFGSGLWNWQSGANLVGSNGSYGTQGTPGGSNAPPARQGAATWADASGNLWLFGGSGLNAVAGFGYLNDLWEYSGGAWTWVGGSNSPGAPGNYGTQGTAASGNVPGARQSAASWIDASGNLWLFGGNGIDSAGTRGLLNDLWKYNAGTWTWIAGANVVGARGVYGTLGTPAASNAPGARYFASTWVDAAGNFWLFGGIGYDATGASGDLNDLWEYSGGTWTWVAGSNEINVPGTYGTLGAAAAANTPGAREGASAWVDANGNFWLFGGAGFDSAGTNGVLNDLWKFHGGQWTWVGGAKIQGAKGVYGSLGVAGSANGPGARNGATAWIDGTGQLWLLGGIGPDSAGAVGYLNDLWRYTP